MDFKSIVIDYFPWFNIVSCVSIDKLVFSYLDTIVTYAPKSESIRPANTVGAKPSISNTFIYYNGFILLLYQNNIN